MTQQVKKPSQPSAKAASVAGKQSENVVKLGSAAVKELLASGATEAQKVQEKAFEMGRESADKLAKSTDAACKVAYDFLGLSKGNMEAAVECGNLTAAFTKDISSEIFAYTNKVFAENMETSKEFFACRTINDMVDLQGKMLKNSLDSLFSETGKVASMLFEYGSEAIEPINERISEANEQFSKAVSSCTQ